LLPILANGGDRLTLEDQAEQPGSSAAFAPLRAIGWRQNRKEEVGTDRGGAQEERPAKRTIDTIRMRKT
jgi:hypothetical protein